MAFDNPDVITIDPEFQAFIPPLTDDEYSDLEQKLLNEGVTEPLKIWACEDQDILIDGHNRYRIIQEHGLDMPDPVYIPGLKTRDDVKLWMIKNQLGRRNISDFAKAELVLKEKDLVAKIKRENSLNNLKNQKSSTASILTVDSKGKRTSELLADEAGISRSTVERTEKILKEAAPEIIEKARSGEMSINAAMKTLKKEEKPEENKDIDPNTGMTLEELEASISEETSLEDVVKEMEGELRQLRRRIETLTASDKDAELMKKDDIIFSHEQRIGMLTDQNYQKGQQLKYNTRLLADIRKLLGVEMNSEIVNAIKAMKGM